MSVAAASAPAADMPVHPPGPSAGGSPPVPSAPLPANSASPPAPISPTSGASQPTHVAVPTARAGPTTPAEGWQSDSKTRSSSDNHAPPVSLRPSRSVSTMRSRGKSSPRSLSRPLSMAAAEQYSVQRQQKPAAIPFRIGVAEDRNKRWRRTMEDAHTFVYDFGGVHGQGFFGVYDGHAGKASADWCGKYLYQYFREHLIHRGNDPVPDVLNATFQSVDVALDELARDTRTSSGCTAVTCFLRLEDLNGVPISGPGTGGVMPDEKGTAGQVFIGGASVAPQKDGITTVAVAQTDVESDAISSVSQLSVIPEPKHHRHTHKGFLSALARRTGLTHRHHPRHHSINIASSDNHRSSLPDEVRSRGRHSIATEDTPARTFDPETNGIPFRRMLYTANVGDARAVLSRGGRAVRLTYDHKGSDPQETARIKEAGGFVMNNRVNGVLAVTRSLGDNNMKEFVVGKPYTTETALGDEDAFLIVACDGLWDVTSDQEAVDLISQVDDPQGAAKILLQHALSNFSTDNTSVMVVRFNAKPGTGFASRILS